MTGALELDRRIAHARGVLSYVAVACLITCLALPALLAPKAARWLVRLHRRAGNRWLGTGLPPSRIARCCPGERRRSLHGRVQVVRRQQDEGIRSASSRTTFLRLRPATSATADPRAPSRSPNPVHARIGDHLGGLLVGQDTGWCTPPGEAGIRVHRGDRCGGLRALRGVLEEDRVSDQQVGAVNRATW